MNIPPWASVLGSSFLVGALTYFTQHLSDLGVVSWKLVLVSTLSAGLVAVAHLYQKVPS